MNNFKNLLIAILTGLLALSLFTQPAQSAAQSAGKSKEAKTMEYLFCLQTLAFEPQGPLDPHMNLILKECAKYRP
jgi:hypothetical protein